MGSHKLTNVATPTSSTDAANKGYVDNAVQGLSSKHSAVAATNTETLTIASGSVTQITGTTVNSKSPAVNDLVLIMNAPASTGAAGGTTLSDQPANGLYIVTGNTTNLTVSRAAEMSGSINPSGAYVFVEGGTTWGSGGFVVSDPASSSAFTYGTGTIQFVQFSGAGEVTVDSSLTKSGNALSRAALTGDVTASAGSNATTIANGAVTLAKLASSAYNTAPTSSTLAEWDANSNLSANALFAGLTSTPTAAGVTTLAVTSTEVQVATGTSTQTYKLPTTGVPAGAQYTIINESSGNVAVQSSGANAIVTLVGAASAPFSVGVFTAKQATPTTAAHWSYALYAAGTASGTVTSVSVATANGFQGSVATATSTPAITLQTSLSAGLIKSNGSNAIVSAATSDVVAGLVSRETPSGTINGSTTSFGLANTPVSGTEMVFLNGILQDAGSGNDYTISGATITMLAAPQSGDKIRVTYWH